MRCPACGLENCDGSCAPAPAPHERLRQAALEAAERRQRESPGDTLPDYDDDEDEDEREEADELELEDEQSDA